MRLWKVELQKFADDTGLTIKVRHYPPGTSKWNKIEHRMFCQITQNWRSRPLTDRAAVVELIAATTTKTGLKIKSALDTKTYAKGIKVSDAEMRVSNSRPSRSKRDALSSDRRQQAQYDVQRHRGQDQQPVIVSGSGRGEGSVTHGRPPRGPGLIVTDAAGALATTVGIAAIGSFAFSAQPANNATITIGGAASTSSSCGVDAPPAFRAARQCERNCYARMMQAKNDC